MFTIHAYIALTALGSIAFWLIAARGARRDIPSRLVPPRGLDKAA